jgi:hypothetical protein
MELLGNLIWKFPPGRNHKRIVFEPRCEGGWSLGFEWLLDHEAPGCLLVSQYQALGADRFYAEDWPFFGNVDMSYKEDHRQHAERHARFYRRIAAKARKERARTGQKLSRSRMPGQWVW